MQETITITLPKEIESALNDVTQKEGIPASDLITRAVEDYLFFRRLRLLRERLSIQARQQSIYTDQDVFDRVYCV
jgi:metal-responsive CopG/Arc/MetJ family transcriptional regulator